MHDRSSIHGSQQKLHERRVQSWYKVASLRSGVYLTPERWIEHHMLSD